LQYLSATELDANFRSANQKQSAYEVVVSDNLAGVSQLKGNIWKSGKVNSAENINVAFQGAALKPFTRITGV
jgi:alpha-L-rhamnosidase